MNCRTRFCLSRYLEKLALCNCLTKNWLRNVEYVTQSGEDLLKKGFQHLSLKLFVHWNIGMWKKNKTKTFVWHIYGNFEGTSLLKTYYILIHMYTICIRTKKKKIHNHFMYVCTMYVTIDSVLISPTQELNGDKF